MRSRNGSGRRGRKVKRDAAGRWLPGTPSPHPQGRPRRKEPARPFDPTDIQDFMRQQVAMKDGVLKFRDELLLLKIFEDAMKGKVTNQRWLQNRLDTAIAAVAKLGFEYKQLLSTYVIDNEKLADLNYKVPADVLRDMKRWHVLLHQQDPHTYPAHMTPQHLIEVFREHHWKAKKRVEAEAKARAEAEAKAKADAAKKKDEPPAQ